MSTIITNEVHDRLRVVINTILADLKDTGEAHKVMAVLTATLVTVARLANMPLEELVKRFEGAATEIYKRAENGARIVQS